IPMAFQDHKRLEDRDKGPNTGGMGAYGPVSFAGEAVVRSVADSVMTPVVQEMNQRGMDYKGFLYAGMMMTREGAKVIEFNVRFGDPEAQPAMMMLKSDLYSIISESINGNLTEENVLLKSGAACCVVLASKGYPEYYEIGLPICGLEGVNKMVEEAKKIERVKVFHAGTKKAGENIITAGGRILGVTAYSSEALAEAHRLAYSAVEKIRIQGNYHYRKDIGEKGLKK
ncbi:MAG: phosphoribosylglycinamide synthetase C domain-containing protein, partial [Nanoarchaeota archaeon]